MLQAQTALLLVPYLLVCCHVDGSSRAVVLRTTHSVGMTLQYTTDHGTSSWLSVPTVHGFQHILHEAAVLRPVHCMLPTNT